VRCASAGADRPECGIGADPAYVVIPQGKKREKELSSAIQDPQVAQIQPRCQPSLGELAQCPRPHSATKLPKAVCLTNRFFWGPLNKSDALATTSFSSSLLLHSSSGYAYQDTTA
jgi:hypothetical protein